MSLPSYETGRWSLAAAIDRFTSSSSARDGPVNGDGPDHARGQVELTWCDPPVLLELGLFQDLELNEMNERSTISEQGRVGGAGEGSIAHRG
jgi:hypothetical protein